MRHCKVAFLFMLISLGTTASAHPSRMDDRNTLFSTKMVFPTAFDPQRFPLRVYYGGSILETEVARNALLFSINKAIYQLTRPHAYRSTPIEFYLLFTKDETPVFLRTDDELTPFVDYYKLPDDTPYKCFKITLFDDVDAASKKLVSRWRIEPHTIKHEIPLNTFRIILDPALVSELKEEPCKAGSNNVKLPSIHLVDDVAALDASLDEAARLALSVVMDSDSLHGRTEKSYKEHFRIGTIQVALCHDKPSRSC